MSYLVLSSALRQKAIRKAIKTLRDSKLKFDSIVCTGISGMLVAPQVAARLGVPLVIVRKDENNHGDDVEFAMGEMPLRYVIVDDFVESGKTIARVQRQMFKLDFENKKKPKCVGVYFYNQSNLGVYLERFRERFPKLWVGSSI